LIVNEEAQSALRGLVLGSADAEFNGGGFAGAIGGFQGMKFELQIFGVREDNAGGRSVAHEVSVGSVRVVEDGVREEEEEAGEAITGGKRDMGAGVGQGYILRGEDIPGFAIDDVHAVFARGRVGFE